MKIVLIICFIATIFSGCTKLYNDEYDERIKRSNIDIEIPTDPTWDSIPPIDNDIDLENKTRKNRLK